MAGQGFFEQVAEVMTLPPTERHARLAALHGAALGTYLAALQAIDADVAEQPVVDGGDARTLVQVVGHIAAWDHFAVLGCGDVLAGVKSPRMVVGQNGYVDESGQTFDFASVDDFNAYYAQRHATWRWEPMRAWATEVALTLHALCTQPHLVTAARLEQTLPHSLLLADELHCVEGTMGWSLWLLVLEHLAVEHAAELGFERIASL